MNTIKEMYMFKNVWIRTIIIALTLTALSYGVGLGFGWITAVNWLEVFAVFTSYASTYLCVVQKRLNYVFGAISSAAYFYLFFQAGLIASMVLNAGLAPWLIYGFFRWRNDANTRPVTHLQLKWSPIYLLGAGAFYLAVFFTVQALGGTLAPIDSIILVATVVAQILLDNKKIENWFVWIVVNLAAIYVYFTSGLFLVGFQYIFFLFNTILGYYSWRKSMHREETLEGYFEGLKDLPAGPIRERRPVAPEEDDYYDNLRSDVGI